MGDDEEHAKKLAAKQAELKRRKSANAWYTYIMRTDEGRSAAAFLSEHRTTGSDAKTLAEMLREDCSGPVSRAIKYTYEIITECDREKDEMTDLYEYFMLVAWHAATSARFRWTKKCNLAATMMQAIWRGAILRSRPRNTVVHVEKKV